MGSYLSIFRSLQGYFSAKIRFLQVVSFGGKVHGRRGTIGFIGRLRSIFVLGEQSHKRQISVKREIFLKTSSEI